MRILMRLLPLLLLPAASLVAAAQGDGGPPDVPIRVYASRDGIVPGGTMRVAVVYEVAADHHIQVNEFLFANPAPGESFQLGSAMIPSTRKWDGEPILSGKASVLYDLTLAGDTPLGERTVKFTVGYQQCSESPVFACFQPEEREATLPIRVVATGTPIQSTHASLFPKTMPPERNELAPAVGAGAVPPAGGEEPAEEGAATEGGGGSASPSISAAPRDSLGEPGASQDGAAAKAGLQEGLPRRSSATRLRGVLGRLPSRLHRRVPDFVHALRLSDDPDHDRVHHGREPRAAFPVSSSLSSSSLGSRSSIPRSGLIAAALRRDLRKRPAERAVLVVIAAVFLAMGASMLGAFNLTLPSGFQTKLQSRRRGGWIGAVMMGGITGLVASPCVGPVLVVLLTWVAQVGRPLYGFTLLFVFAVGLGRSLPDSRELRRRAEDRCRAPAPGWIRSSTTSAGSFSAWQSSISAP